MYGRGRKIWSKIWSSIGHLRNVASILLLLSSSLDVDGGLRGSANTSGERRSEKPERSTGGGSLGLTMASLVPTTLVLGVVEWAAVGG